MFSTLKKKKTVHWIFLIRTCIWNQFYVNELVCINTVCFCTANEIWSCKFKTLEWNPTPLRIQPKSLKLCDSNVQRTVNQLLDLCGVFFSPESTVKKELLAIHSPKNKLILMNLSLRWVLSIYKYIYKDRFPEKSLFFFFKQRLEVWIGMGIPWDVRKKKTFFLLSCRWEWSVRYEDWWTNKDYDH